MAARFSSANSSGKWPKNALSGLHSEAFVHPSRKRSLIAAGRNPTKNATILIARAHSLRWNERVSPQLGFGVFGLPLGLGTASNCRASAIVASFGSCSQISSPAPSDKTPVDKEALQNAARAKEIIEQGIEALGGQTYLTIRDRESQGRGYGFHSGRPTGVAGCSGASLSFLTKSESNSPRSAILQSCTSETKDTRLLIKVRIRSNQRISRITFGAGDFRSIHCCEPG